MTGAAGLAPGDVLAALTDVIESVRSSPDGSAFARRFGSPEPSERRPGGLGVRPTSGPFELLDVRPWVQGTTGVVDVDLAPEVPLLTWQQVQDRFGPFEYEPSPGSHRPWYSATVPGTSGPEVVLMVRVKDDRNTAGTGGGDGRAGDGSSGEAGAAVVDGITLCRGLGGT